MPRSRPRCAAVHGSAAGDPFIIVKPERAYVEELEAPAGNLRIAYTAKPWAPHPLDPEVIKAVEEVASVCEEMGHIVEEASPDADFEKVNAAVMIAFGMAETGISELAAAMGRKISADYLEPLGPGKGTQGRYGQARHGRFDVVTHADAQNSRQ